MGVILKFFLVLIIVFWILGKLASYLMRLWIMDKSNEYRRQDALKKKRAQQASRRPGDVRVENRQDGARGIGKNVGDYVDYEEIKE